MTAVVQCGRCGQTVPEHEAPIAVWGVHVHPRGCPVVDVDADEGVAA